MRFCPCCLVDLPDPEHTVIHAWGNKVIGCPKIDPKIIRVIDPDSDISAEHQVRD